MVDSLLKSIEFQDYRLLGNATIIDGTSGGRVYYNAREGFSKFLLGSSICEKIKIAPNAIGKLQMSDICIVKDGSKKILSVLIYNGDVSILVSYSTYNEKLKEFNKDLEN